jgi:hypothetical protein
MLRRPLSMTLALLLFVAVGAVVGAVGIGAPAHAAGPPSNVDFILTPADPAINGSSGNECLYSDRPSVAVVTLNACGGFQYTWRVTASAASGYNRLVLYDDRCLEAISGGVRLGTCAIGPASQSRENWRVDWIGSAGQVQFTSQSAGQCLAALNSTDVGLAACGGVRTRWLLAPATFDVHLRSVYSGHCLRTNLTAPNGLASSTCSTTNELQVFITGIRDLPRVITLFGIELVLGGRYEFHPLEFGGCIGTASTDPPNGTAVTNVGASCLDGRDWMVLPTSGYQSYQILWDNGRCLDLDTAVNGGGLLTGTRVQVWDCLGLGQTNQLWRIEPALE